MSVTLGAINKKALYQMKKEMLFTQQDIWNYILAENIELREG